MIMAIGINSNYMGQVMELNVKRVKTNIKNEKEKLKNQDAVKCLLNTSPSELHF